MRMLRLLVFLAVVAGLAAVVSRYADKPGTIRAEWLGYQVETNVLVAGVVLLAVVVLLLFLWSVLRYLATRPAALRRSLRARKERRGREALSSGLIAIGAGDRERAHKSAALAAKALPDDPLTLLLKGQSAQLSGDRVAARRAFEAMTESPQTELFGLHGLFLEAQRENEPEAARQFAERAMRRNPKLAWSVNALFELQCKTGDWNGALKTLTVARDHKQIDRDTATRRCAVLLTAQAQEAEESDVDRARELALEAHKLAPDLVPAAEIAGRLLASHGNTARAARVIAKTWRLSPHPDLAAVYAHARPGDSPGERLARVQTLAQSTPDSVEGPIAIAAEAIGARDWETARAALEPLLEDRPTARICTLMARIEGGESGDAGRVREWLARAVRAPRDPAWTADGIVSDHWSPVSPATGALDVFEWRVPVEVLGPEEEALVIEGLAAEAPPPMLPAEPPAAAEAAPARPAALTAATPDADAAAETPPPVERAAVESEEAAAPAEAEPEPEVAAEAAETGPPDGDGAAAAEGDAEKEPASDTPAEEEVLVPPPQPDDPGTEHGEAEERQAVREGNGAAQT